MTDCGTAEAGTELVSSASTPGAPVNTVCNVLVAIGLLRPVVSGVRLTAPWAASDSD